MLLRDLLATLEDLAPTRYAEPWDNVGLLAGDPAQVVTRAMHRRARRAAQSAADSPRIWR